MTDFSCDPIVNIFLSNLGSDNGSITIDVWNDLCTLVGSHDSMDGCKLGLNLIQDSIKLISSNYVQKRMISGETFYSLINREYVSVIGKFVRGVCLGLVERWAESISMDTADHSAGIGSRCFCCPHTLTLITHSHVLLTLTPLTYLHLSLTNLPHPHSG